MNDFSPRMHRKKETRRSETANRVFYGDEYKNWRGSETPLTESNDDEKHG